MGLDYYVKEGVLIPRPETELIPEYIYSKFQKEPPKVVYDICTGTGCIGITIAKLFPTCKVYCVDISETAINYATKNKENLCCNIRYNG